MILVSGSSIFPSNSSQKSTNPIFHWIIKKVYKPRKQNVPKTTFIPSNSESSRVFHDEIQSASRSQIRCEFIRENVRMFYSIFLFFSVIINQIILCGQIKSKSKKAFSRFPKIVGIIDFQSFLFFIYFNF